MVPIQKNPDYAALNAEIVELVGAQAKVLLRIEDLLAQRRAQKAEPEDGSASRVAAALAWASGAAPVTRPAIAATDTTAEELSALREQEQALRNTIAARRTALDTLVGELSAKVHGEKLKVHHDLVSRYLKRLAELDALLEEERALVSDIEAAGYRPMFATTVYHPTIGSMRERSASAIWHKSHELAQYVR